MRFWWADVPNFYPRPPRGGRRAHQLYLCRSHPISIHALREEGDVYTPESIKGAKEDFYPRPPRGGRQCAQVSGAIDTQVFLSTPSARRATVEATLDGLTQYDFYPRPPRGGRPKINHQKPFGFYFYPRPPRGGRPKALESASRYAEFLSTPSARRATLAFRCGIIPDLISIHALREEGDTSCTASHKMSRLFLSTPSARRATTWDGSLGADGLFLSTPSARRATWRQYDELSEKMISIHALREEGDG